ncbi:tropomyosin-related kinase [Apostichopus japonicus]|uniref:Tropomyosin-related kinase n=1 Tax=Stichopus japonicus TaxID=307972 RepID=A0A2G8JET4_STIJA|nr:tropomyosin-related kinase [Apostichopus japonicus]
MKDTINHSRYNWEMFAKKIIELPGCRHIAECVGLCLDGEKLLVLQSYSHSVDLHSYLSEDNKADESNFTSRRLQLSSQVLLGMEFLVSHGLAHPGLTTKKIRITEEKDGFSTICHSPEAVARNEHDLGSDVWYTAFTIWEVLYTNDTISTEIDDTYAKAIVVHEDKMPCFTKPRFCPEPLFAILTDCWKLKSYERPALSKLRSVFQDEGALSLTDHLPELLAVPSDDDVSSANSYESMKGHTSCT